MIREATEVHPPLPLAGEGWGGGASARRALRVDSPFPHPPRSGAQLRCRARPASGRGNARSRVRRFNFQAANLRHTSAIPRRDAPESCMNRSPRKTRAQGMPGAQCTRSLVCDKKQTHERSHHGHTGNHPAFPAQWLYGVLRALPGDEFVLPPSSAD